MIVHIKNKDCEQRMTISGKILTTLTINMTMYTAMNLLFLRDYQRQHMLRLTNE